MRPNLIILGAQKCGTTSLHHYLRFHPEIDMSGKKELNYFNEELNWKRGPDWYRSQFPGEAPVAGESSPNYTRYPEFSGVAEKINEYSKDFRFIYIVRDPIERAVSSYMDMVKGGYETRPVSAALNPDTRPNPYLDIGCYAMQLERYLRYFDRSRFLIIDAEQIKKERLKVLREIFIFLGVDPSFETKHFFTEKNVSKETKTNRKLSKIERFSQNPDRPKLLRILVKPLVPVYLKIKNRSSITPGQSLERPKLGEDLKKQLQDFFREDAAKLRRITGMEFKSWSV